MTPEHGSKSEENCNLRSAKAGHSSNICLSSPNASVRSQAHRATSRCLTEVFCPNPQCSLWHLAGARQLHQVVEECAYGHDCSEGWKGPG